MALFSPPLPLPALTYLTSTYTSTHTHQPLGGAAGGFAQSLRPPLPLHAGTRSGPQGQLQNPHILPILKTKYLYLYVLCYSMFSYTTPILSPIVSLLLPSVLIPMLWYLICYGTPYVMLSTMMLSL